MKTTKLQQTIKKKLQVSQMSFSAEQKTPFYFYQLLLSN